MSEEKVDQLLALGHKSEAVQQLYEMILQAAEKRDFAKAEGLRLRLIAADDMALIEIIGAAEVIDAARSAAIDPSYHEQWQDLCHGLSEEENNALYYALKEISLKPGTAFIEQGKLNNRLFFISQGQTNLVCQHGARQFLLEKLNAGDIAGEDTFFGISICTTSVVCQGQVTVKYLDRKSMEAWQESFPGLEEKLRAYCLGHSRLDSAKAAKNLERRHDTRFPLEGVVNAQLQDLKGQDLGASFRGVLEDVSAGGICFYIKSSTQSTARMLLGRPVSLSFSWINLGLYVRGVIVSSKYHLRNDYTVHVKVTNRNDPLFVELVQKIRADRQGNKKSFK